MPHPIFLRLPVASTNDQLYSSSFAAPSCCIDCLSIDYIMWHPHLLCYKPCNQFLNFWCLQLSWLSTLMYIGLDRHMMSMILTIFNFWYPHKVARNPSILTSLLLPMSNKVLHSCWTSSSIKRKQVPLAFRKVENNTTPNLLAQNNQ
jgi:hypothetical protein